MSFALPSLAIRTRLTLWYTTVLFAILVLISALSYSVLAWSLRQDLDASLLTVARVVRDTGHSGAASTHLTPEVLLRELLGPDFYDKFVQLFDPQGNLGFRSMPRSQGALPLSAEARANADRGLLTLETVEMPDNRRARVVTLPLVEGGRVAQLVQVGMPLDRMDHTLRRYVQALLVLIPLGLLLAAAGGAVTARVALGPVDQMTRTARRITAEDLAQRIAVRGTGDELDRLAETLNGMLARLESTFAQLRRFAADAAHELRTPLTALKGGIEVALRAERSGEEYRTVLASSLEDVERLSRLAEDLLLLSRLTAGVEEARAPVDLEPLALEVLDVGSRLAQETGVSLRLAEAEPLTVIGNARSLRRALLNLVDNAVKYTPAGGKVELALSRHDGRAELSVQDTGTGIEASQLERIFQPFVRLDEARVRAQGGAGLGLAIARSIVEAHGGELGVESTPEAGSRFTIRLPLASESA
jgi:heavy metal sensor kinase